MPRFLPLAAVLLAASLASAAEHWPQFRGPTGDGHSAAKGVPTRFGDTENVRWKVAIHDKGWSSPVVWGDQIWLTTGRVDGKELFAVCVDRKTGAIVHDIKLFADPNPAFCHPFNSYATPTPVVEEGRVYVHFGVHGTACLDTATGKALWQRKDLPCNHHRGPGSSPIVYKNLLVLTFDGFDVQYVVALDKATGETVWRKDRNIKYTSSDGDIKKAYSTPSVLEVDGKPQLVSPAAEATIAYEPMTGAELWRVSHGGMNEAAKPVLAHGLIYLSSGHTSNLVAVRAGQTGAADPSAVAWRAKEAPTRPSVLVVGDLLFMVNDGGVATCLEAKTGKQVWKERFNGPFSASPVLVGGKIYFCSENGKVFVVEASREYNLLETNTFPAGFMASPAAVGDELILRTKTHLYCVGKK